MTGTDSEDFLRRTAQARARISEVSAEDALRPDHADQILMDVRGEDEYAQGHLAGAVNIPLDKFSERAETDLPDKGAPVVCYCNGGNRGALAADALRQMGFSNVVSLAGGLNAVPEPLKNQDG
ncbi:rhodanese-like domain-containing protein [Nesterenkonia sp. Act20]|uniref:rhodanese-like domain-containing protein n=1 Tax=Nesterenkonia sp. Act20 TaxID=1483432 RepID=UPI001C43FEAD|nr:rhodanese-like domain-containing protein [Nesterenkonia sp. Act20]